MLLVVLFAISGYRQGFIVGVLSFVGFVGGVILGMLIAPPLVKTFVDGPAEQALLAVIIAFLMATLGQLAASSIGSAIRSRVTSDSARSVDAVGGAIVSSAALLVVAWFIGSALVTSPITWLRTQVEGLPGAARGERLHTPAGRDLVLHLPRVRLQHRVSAGLQRSRWRVHRGRRPPDPTVMNAPELRTARRSIVAIIGTARSCPRKIEGTGFVLARGA